MLLNWITTGDHLAHSLVHRHLWAVAGMDALLLIAALTAGATALRLSRRAIAYGLKGRAWLAFEESEVRLIVRDDTIVELSAGALDEKTVSS